MANTVAGTFSIRISYGAIQIQPFQGCDNINLRVFAVKFYLPPISTALYVRFHLLSTINFQLIFGYISYGKFHINELLLK